MTKFTKDISSPKLLVKTKFNKLLPGRRVVLIHAWKGRDVRLKSVRFKLTYDILLQITYDNNLLIFRIYWITTSI